MFSDIPRPSSKEAEILRLLIVHGEMYGLELAAASPELKRGTIYVTLDRMYEKGWVQSKEVKVPREPGLPRRVFSLTATGSRVFRAWERAIAVLREELA
jgi:PadR family transcriptional regulator, regulatory protein PadR